MANFSAVFDACVLYPFLLRDLLLQLALTDLFRAKWTDRIHDEWIGSLLEKRPELAEQLERTRSLMNCSVRDCLVTGYEQIEQSLELPDAKDRHVLAAAIVGHAQVIVTFNLKDFPDEKLKPFGIEAQHPDEFITNLMDLSPQMVCASAKKCRARLKKPMFDVEQYLDALAHRQLTNTVSILRESADLL
jgi:predicted nucleic acid-binding protein